MFETVLTLAAAVCAADLAWMYARQKRAGLATDGDAQPRVSTAPLIRRAAYYALALIVIYSFGGWLSLG